MLSQTHPVKIKLANLFSNKTYLPAYMLICAGFNENTNIIFSGILPSLLPVVEDLFLVQGVGWKISALCHTKYVAYLRK